MLKITYRLSLGEIIQIVLGVFTIGIAIVSLMFKIPNQLKMQKELLGKLVESQKVTVILDASEQDAPKQGDSQTKPSGTLTYFERSKGAFIGEYTLNKLTSNQTYVFSLHGNPGNSCNDPKYLTKPYKGKDGSIEYYVDHHEKIIVNAEGNATGNLRIPMAIPPGPCDVDFLVKDEDTWKVVLQKNFGIRFWVE
uniref:Uncharacterized protein n=1 Tax=Candidatus Kentrum sp. UNK TaxID=2126344 RepID=A0A451A9F4_9GAMM|nr:MAG: hypothetical protein BECKUNK1418G_GA0071005_10265 [Candidatus Kentron sp. UNK]VFK70560.1 MAG: hypothetical protein BECKUNK1418H_GA0071006_10325 [Candidatus Kentron sp. UNK]